MNRIDFSIAVRNNVSQAFDMHRTPLRAIPRANDLSACFAERMKEPKSASSISFYDRPTKSWKSENQADFLRRSTAVSDLLQSAELRPGDHVILATSSPEATLLAFVGSVVVGAIPTVLPIRTAFDGREVIARRIIDASHLLGNRTTVVVESKAGRLIADPPADVPWVSFDVSDCRSPLKLPPEIGQSSGPISHVQLTSGSTGAGKGVAVTHANVFANIRALQERAAISAYDVYVSWLPLYHDMGLVSQALMTLTLDIELFLMSPFDFLADPSLWLRTMSEKRGSVTASPAFGYDLVTERVTDEELVALDLSSWKSAYCGAEPIRAAGVRRFFDKFAPCGLRPETFTPSYGLAEATLAVTGIESSQVWRTISVSKSSLGKLGKVDVSGPEPTVEVVALGKPVDGLTVYLLDGDGHRVTEELVCGEVVVRGSSVAAGWIREGGVLEPFGNDGLHTGDIGFMQDGELFVVERIKNIVIRNGHNYSAQVLEQTLAGIADVSADEVVVLDRDIVAGSGLTGVVELPKHVDVSAALNDVLSRADEFEPPLESVVFVKRGSLPRTTSGKKQHMATREALNSGFLATLLEADVAPTKREVVAEENVDVDLIALGKASETAGALERERTLLAIVATAVRSRGIDAPVIMSSTLQHDLDIDSLGLLELAMQCEEAFSVEMTREAVADVRTVRDLMNAVVEAKPKGDALGGLMSQFERLKAEVPQYYTVVDDVRPGREILVQGRWMTDFGSCGYLGLEERPEIAHAATAMHLKWGSQRWSTRAVGLPRPVLELERRLADVIGVEDTMIFGTITLLHTGVLPVLAGVDGAIIIDSAAHTSMQEAAALARGKGTSVMPFRHGNLLDLESKLRKSVGKSNRIVVLDGVYSMSGSLLQLESYQALAKKYDAWLYVDDAHGFGVVGEEPSIENPLGRRGNGIVKHLGGTYDRLIYVGGLGKAYSTPLGFVSCPTPEFRELFHSASTVIFGHLTTPAVIGQAMKSLEINDAEGDILRNRLIELRSQLVDGAEKLGFEVRSRDSAVINVVIGDVDSLILATNVLWDDGVKITPAMFPAVPLNEGGLRFTITATNTPAQVEQVLASLTRIRRALDGSPTLDVRMSKADEAERVAVQAG